MNKIILALLLTSCNFMVQPSLREQNYDYYEVEGLHEHMATVLRRSKELGINIADLSLVQPRIKLHEELEDLQGRDNLYQMQSNVRAKVLTNHLLHYFPQETIDNLIQSIDEYTHIHGVVIMEMVDRQLEHALRNYIKHRPKGTLALQKLMESSDLNHALTNYLIALRNLDDNDTDASSDISPHNFNSDSDSDDESDV